MGNAGEGSSATISPLIRNPTNNSGGPGEKGALRD